MQRDVIRIGDAMLSLDEAEETLCALHGGHVDGVVVEGLAGAEVYTFRDPGHPYRLLVEAMGEGAALTTLDGLICYQNPYLRELLGAEDDLVYGRPLGELVPPSDRPRLEDLLERARAAPSAARTAITIMGPNGTIPVQLSVSRAALADVPVLAVVVTDLSEHQRQEQLYRTARLEIEARDRIFSVAAHELRNPLWVLQLQAHLLTELLRTAFQAQPQAAERAIGMVNKLQVQGERMAALLGKLLDIGSIGAGKLALEHEQMDFAKVVNTVAERCQEFVSRSGSTVTLHMSETIGRWDRVRVEQVVENLLSNAAKYGLGHPIQLHVERDGDLARLIVEDQGNGIPAEARDRIFRPYERMAGTQGTPGLGLGLYITAEIVKAHGGTIRVEPRSGGGSRFIVELPLEHQPAL